MNFTICIVSVCILSVATVSHAAVLRTVNDGSLDNIELSTDGAEERLATKGPFISMLSHIQSFLKDSLTSEVSMVSHERPGTDVFLAPYQDFIDVNAGAERSAEEQSVQEETNITSLGAGSASEMLIHQEGLTLEGYATAQLSIFQEMLYTVMNMRAVMPKLAALSLTGLGIILLRTTQLKKNTSPQPSGVLSIRRRYSKRF